VIQLDAHAKTFGARLSIARLKGEVLFCEHYYAETAFRPGRLLW